MKWLALLLLVGCASEPEAPFATAIVSFDRGANAGFGQDQMPDIVLGEPRGAGRSMGSLDVLSLGDEGVITLELGRAAIDGEGIDLLVFENAFVYGGTELFAEPGEVSVSEDGETFVAFACDPTAPYAGCAGISPVFANTTGNDLDPLDPEMAGGDGFDLADLGVAGARFVRIRDMGVSPPMFVGSQGFDLDAVAAVHVAP